MEGAFKGVENRFSILMLLETSEDIEDTISNLVKSNIEIILLDNTCRRMRIYGEICSKKIYAVSGDCICHQAMFARRELFDEKRFDLHYRACADREWQFHFIKKKKIFGCMKFTVAIFRVEGFCTSHMAEYEEETLQCVEKNYDRYIVLGYKVIARMKESRILRQVLRLCGRLLFHKPV